MRGSTKATQDIWKKRPVGNTKIGPGFAFRVCGSRLRGSESPKGRIRTGSPVFRPVEPWTAVGFKFSTGVEKRLCPLKHETRRLAWKKKVKTPFWVSMHRALFHSIPGLPQSEQPVTSSAAIFAQKKTITHTTLLLAPNVWNLSRFFCCFCTGSVDERKRTLRSLHISTPQP